jgi:hypothetical protein
VGDEGRLCGVVGAFARGAGRALGGVAFVRSSLCHCAIWPAICSALATRGRGLRGGVRVLGAGAAVRFWFATVEGGGTGLRATRYGFEVDFGSGSGVGAVEGVLRPDGAVDVGGPVLRVEVTGLRGTRRGGTLLPVSNSFVVAILAPGCEAFGTIA